MEPIDNLFNIIKIHIDNEVLYRIEGKTTRPEHYDRIEKGTRYIVIDANFNIYPQFSSPIHIQKYIFWGLVKGGIIKQYIELSYL